MREYDHPDCKYSESEVHPVIEVTHPDFAYNSDDNSFVYMGIKYRFITDSNNMLWITQ